VARAGWPEQGDKFLFAKHTKTGKRYQMTTKYMYQMDVRNSNDNYFPIQGPPKYTQIGIFGMKMYHLATLC
jgi:hypothetical protein